MTVTASPLRMTVVGLGALAVAMGIGRFAFTPLLPLMQSDGVVTVAEGGLLASVHFVGYLMGAVAAPFVPASPRTTLRTSLVAIGLATLASGLTESITVLLALRWLAGTCSAFALVTVSGYCVKRLGQQGHRQNQGWVFSGVGAGIAAAGLGTLGVLAAGIASMPAWQIFGAASLAAALMVSIAAGDEYPDRRAEACGNAAPRSPLAWRLIFPYGALGMGYIIPATYLPIMARDAIASPLLFGWAWPVFGAAAFVSTILASRLERRHSGRRIWIASQLVMAAGLVLPLAWQHLAMVIMSGVLIGGTFMIMTMMGLKEVHRTVPPEDAVRQIAMMTAAFAVGQMIGPVFAALVYDVTQSFAAALLPASAVLAITVLILIERRGAAVTDRT